VMARQQQERDDVPRSHLVPASLPMSVGPYLSVLL
jgi:hypothetical protein